MDGFSQGMDALVVLVALAATFPALGVSAALGSMAFGVRVPAAPKGLPRRAEVLMLLSSLIVPVLFAFASFSWLPNHENEAMLAPYYAGAAVPLGSSVFAPYVRTHTGRRARCPMTFVLAVLPYLVYVAPALSYVYAFRRV